MFSKSVNLAQYDPELAAAIAQEDQRQQDHVELIASENYVSCAVMEAQGSQLTNKYAEGYPGKRYTAAANTLTSSNNWQSTASKNSSVRNTPTSNPIPAPKPTKPCTLPSSNPATPSSA